MAIILYAILAYVLYRFIFGFVIPVYRATRQVKKQFRNMQQMHEDNLRQQQAAQQPTPKPEPKKPVGDYIDFEEVK